MKNKFITFLVLILLCSIVINANQNNTNITNSTENISVSQNETPEIPQEEINITNFTPDNSSNESIIEEVKIVTPVNNSVENLIILAPPGDSYEPDENHTTSNSIPVDGTKQQHTFEIGMDFDYINFSAKKGAVYVIETNDLVGNTDTMIALYDTDGTTKLEENDDVYIGNTRSELEWTALTTGVYFVAINDFDENMINGIYNVSIMEYSGLNLTLVTPNSNSNVRQNKTFVFSVNVTCLGVDCENVYVYLDPKKEKPTIPQAKVSGNLLDNLDNLEDKDYKVIIKLKDTKNITTKKGKKINLEKERISILNNKDLLSSIKEENIKVQDSVINSLGNNFVLERQNKAINSMSGTVDKAGLIDLASNPNVVMVSEVETYQINLDVSVPHIGTEDAWNTQYEGTNITGSGQTICVIDTGIDYTHPYFGGYDTFPNAKIIEGYDYCADDINCTTEDYVPLDLQGHGTHCAGVAASNDTTYRGVAPDAKLIAIKACNITGGCWNDDIESGVDWCVNNASKYNITAISISIGGGGPYQEYCDDGNTLAQAINNANDLGIAVVVAAGNNGWYFGVSSPACASGAITVSASNDVDEIDTWPGATYGTGYNRGVLTDLFAPGRSITSAYKNGGTATSSGTSMSTPHVAGAVALINQYYKLHDGEDLHSEEVKEILINSGTPINDSDSKLTIPRIDITSAISSAVVKGVIPMNSGSPFYTTTQNPIVINLSANQTTQLNWTINSTGNYGKYDFFVFVNVSDEIENSESDHVNLTIINNTIPILSQIPTQETNEDTNKSFDASSYVSDLDLGETLTFLITNYTSSAVVCGVDGNNLTIIPASEFSGNTNCTVLVTDGTDNSTEVTFNISVNTTNDAPIILSTPITSTVINQLYSYQVNATDAENDTLSYNLLTSPSNMTINTSGYITWTPNSTGNFSVDIVVNDSNNSEDNQSFVIIVDSDSDNDSIGDSNDPLIGNQSDVALEGNLSTLNITVSGSDNLSNVSNATGSANVIFKEENVTLIEFTFDFSNGVINLTNVTLNKTASNSSSGFIVHGLPSGLSKKLFINDSVIGAQSVCIRDVDNASIPDSSGACISGETQVNCPGSSGAYSCAIVGSFWKISGLSHSAVRQSTTIITTPSGSSGGGGGGGGGSDDEEEIINETCNEQWVCDQWSECKDNNQERTCIEMNDCGTLKYEPDFTKDCSKKIKIVEPTTIPNVSHIVEEPEGDQEIIKDSVQINPLWVGIIMVIVIGLIFQFGFHFKKKK